MHEIFTYKGDRVGNLGGKGQATDPQTTRNSLKLIQKSESNLKKAGKNKNLSKKGALDRLELPSP